jgi:signal transduction histidine kinase
MYQRPGALRVCSRLVFFGLPAPSSHDPVLSTRPAQVSPEPDSPPGPLTRGRALLQATLEASADALLLTDAAGRPEAANRRLLALFGLAPAELAGLGASSLAGRLATRCREPSAAAARFDAVQASADEASDLVELADGRRFERFSQPVSLDGHRVGRLWRLREIGTAEAAPLSTAEEAARTLRLKDEFISTLSHALRTPMGAVLGWAKALQLKRGDTASLERGLDAIARNATLQARLLDEMVDAERVLTGKLGIAPQPLDVAALVSAAIEAHRPTADAKGLRLEASLEPPVGAFVGDPERLRQVVAALLGNAIRFTPAGGRVEVRLRPAGGHALELEVRDDGAGIEPSRLARVFQRHDPGDPASIRPRGGVGLALPVAHRLVELHGGSISAASEGSGRGATFTVRLPVSGAEEPSGTS